MSMSAEEQFASFVKEISSKKNIVVLAGAGISVSCGIPDFRSHGTGLYHTLNYQELGLTSAEDLFDIESFRRDPRPFFRFAKNLYPSAISPSPSHAFLSWLEQKKMLLRVYTQNIDGLEESAGVAKGRVVYAHGSSLDATCVKCGREYAAKDIAGDVEEGRVPLCAGREKKKSPTDETKRDGPAGRTLRKRSFRQYSEDECWSGDSKDGTCGGVIKPNITFFGEKIGRDVGMCLEKDYARADALIVMGTSLSVAPMSRVVEYLPPNVYRVLINRNIIHPPSSSDDKLFSFDMCLLGNCDDVVQSIKQHIMTHSNAKDLSINTPESLGKDKDATWLKNQPPNTVLLFNGAITNTIADQSIHKLVVYCDGCKREINGSIHCCKTCFDFDLCDDCFPSLSLTHADGSHEFGIEEA